MVADNLADALTAGETDFNIGSVADRSEVMVIWEESINQAKEALGHIKTGNTAVWGIEPDHFPGTVSPLFSVCFEGLFVQ